MIGIDTNILVRFITQDDFKQVSKVAELFELDAGVEKSIFINNMVICELVWVLSTSNGAYNYSKPQIIVALEKILKIEEFAFENKEILWSALESFQNHNLDFSDALISATNSYHGCISTYTFDKSASVCSEFTLL